MGIRENNFNGKGIVLETNLSIGQDSVRGMVNYSHPNFAYSERALNTSLESTVTDKLTTYGYKSTLNRVSLGTRYEQFDNIFFHHHFQYQMKVLKQLLVHHLLIKSKMDLILIHYFHTD